jgi:excisionase family DNA binding protein
MNPIDIFPKVQTEETPFVMQTQTAVVPLVLTIEEAAERLGIGRSLMYALVKSGDVESVTIGRLRRIPTDALSTFVASLRTPKNHQAA